MCHLQYPVSLAYLFCVTVLSVGFHYVDCYTEVLDCSLSQKSDGSGTHCQFYDTVHSEYVNFYCYNEFKCCGNTCCFSGSKEYMYTEGEIAGVVLSGSALLVCAFMSLVICGATYCNSKDDESHLFMSKRQRKLESRT